MLNPIQPGLGEVPRRRLSVGRVVFWILAAGVPLAALSAAGVLWASSASMDAAVAAYRNAKPCPADTTVTATCYTLIPGTLVSYSISRGKTGDTTNMSIQTASGVQSTWARTSWAQEDLLHNGVAVRVQFYQEKLTAVYIGDRGIATRDSPLSQQHDAQELAVVVALFGLAISGAMLFTRSRNRKMSQPLVAAAMTWFPSAAPAQLTVAFQQSAAAMPVSPTLPWMLRPHPMPTGRPWWIAPIVIAFAVPSLLLRMRTPTQIAEVVLVVSAGAIVAGIVLHWLYRNRRMAVVDEFAVRRVNLWGGSRVVPRADIAGVAFPTLLGWGQLAPEPRLLLLDTTGRCLLRLSRYYSTRDEAAQLAAALRVPLDATASGLITPAQLRRLVPGAAGWTEAHPWLTSLLLLPPILVGVGLLIWTLNGFR